MSLSKLQRKFTYKISCLIQHAYTMGCELTLGDAYRDARVFGEVGVKKSYSSSNSLHKSRLALDLNLFVDGKYITDGNHPAYVQLGQYWELIGGTWGGRFNDANHFSMEYQGRK